jgi:hypothetical protein
MKMINPFWNVALWILQSLLAATLLWAASVKLFMPADKLAVMWPWTVESRKLVIVTGTLDGLAGLGLILPGLLNIMPKLTVYAAIGTHLLMVAAMIFHVCRGESSQIGINVVIAVICLLIAWGRG